MTAEPLTAACRRCSTSFELWELVERRDGRCPGCEEALSPEYTILLIEEAEKLQTLHDAFIRGLRRLAGVPGNLRLHPAPVMRNLATEVPWDDQLVTHSRRVTDEIDRARHQLASWTAAEGTPTEAENAVAAADRLRRIADQLRTLGVLLDIGQDLAGAEGEVAAGADARQVADDLDADADELTRGGRTHRELVERLDAATAAAGETGAERGAPEPSASEHGGG
jgi:hypothetical protein